MIPRRIAGNCPWAGDRSLTVCGHLMAFGACCVLPVSRAATAVGEPERGCADASRPPSQPITASSPPAAPPSGATASRSCPRVSRTGMAARIRCRPARIRDHRRRWAAGHRPFAPSSAARPFCRGSPVCSCASEPFRAASQAMLERCRGDRLRHANAALPAAGPRAEFPVASWARRLRLRYGAARAAAAGQGARGVFALPHSEPGQRRIGVERGGMGAYGPGNRDRGAATPGIAGPVPGGGDVDGTRSHAVPARGRPVRGAAGAGPGPIGGAATMPASAPSNRLWAACDRGGRGPRHRI